MKLNSENVHNIFMECLFKDGEDTTTHVLGEGVMMKTGFHPERLEARKNDIHAMLKDLPIEFQQSGGGGYTFLNACNDKDGVQWADLHETMDKLLVLGLASKKATILMPREMWSALPGGMPYFVVNN